MRIIYIRLKRKRRIEKKLPYKGEEKNLTNLYLINLFNKFLDSLNEEQEKKKASLEKEEG